MSFEDDMFTEVMVETAKEMTEEEAIQWYKDLPEEVSFGDEALLYALVKAHPGLRDKLVALDHSS